MEKDFTVDLLETKRTYKTRENAVAALKKTVGGGYVRYVIAVNEEGRFAPVIVGADKRHWARNGLTVVS